MNKDDKTSNFWTFISKRMHAKAPLANWRLKLGNELDFEKLQKNYLTPTGDISGLIMCPKQCNPSCGFRKVFEWEGKYEAVCREWPLKSYDIEKVDALIFTIKASYLLSEIAKIFQISSHIQAFYKEKDTWQLGDVMVSEQKPATVYLTLNIWEHEVADLIFRLNSKEQRPYILLGTARKVISQASDAILKDMGSAYVPLNEVIDFNAQTEFELLRECNLAQLITPLIPEPELEPENIFRKCGEAWEVKFDGGEKFILTNCSTGAAYLHFMLSRPGTSTPITEIIRKVSGDSENYVADNALEEEKYTVYENSTLTNFDNLADDRALQQYRDELSKIKHEIEIAEAEGNNITVEQLQQDMECLKNIIGDIISPTGQKKHFPDSRKRLLDALRRSVLFTIDKIEKHHFSLANHLKTTIKYGQLTGYLPESRISWEL